MLVCDSTLTCILLSHPLTVFFFLDELKNCLTLTSSIQCPLCVSVKTQITRPPQNQTITKSTNAVLPCGVSHDPAIVVTWTWTFRAINQDQEQKIVPDGQKRILDSAGTLRITGINNGDIGNYTCDMVSLGGNDSRTVTLKVIGKCLVSDVLCMVLFQFMKDFVVVKNFLMSSRQGVPKNVDLFRKS